MQHSNPYIVPLLVDVPTACAMLSIKRTKCFGLMNLPPPAGLSRIKIGSKTLVTLESVRRLAGEQPPNPSSAVPADDRL
jgi:hypothetical protein